MSECQCVRVSGCQTVSVSVAQSRAEACIFRMFQHRAVVENAFLQCFSLGQGWGMHFYDATALGVSGCHLYSFIVVFSIARSFISFIRYL